jgi:hypothetical protein
MLRICLPVARASAPSQPTTRRLHYMTHLAILTVASVCTALALAPSTASAKTCKEPLTVTSRSTIKTDEAARTKRATANAEKKWSKEARAKYGLQYYFPTRADAKSVECRQTPKSSICTMTATPCSLL